MNAEEKEGSVQAGIVFSYGPYRVAKQRTLQTPP